MISAILLLLICLALAVLIGCNVAAAGAHIGIKAVLYINTGSFGSPTWAACSLISEVTLSPKWEEGDASTRGSRLKQSVKTLMDIGITAKMRVDYADSNFALFWAAANNDTVVNLLILDGSIGTTGAFGYWLDCQIFGNNEAQPINGVEYMDFDIKPTATANQQSSVVMAASNTPTSTVIGS